MLITVLGGIGIFLLGMSMLTNGLKEIAGNTLKKWMNTFTKSKISAIFTGTITTILLQSSTATTLLTVGFVSAGILTFTQSIGVIIGANIGHTSTGWIISLIGFKLSLQAMALPIITLGVIIQYLAPFDWKRYGGVLCGFGLLFLGIDLLQKGMANAQDMVNFENIQTDSFFSIILLIFIGIVMTIIMQASSAAMAATLTALFAGAIQFDQAAYLVIGQSIGTTATAIFASFGASVSAKRTAMAHLMFNVVTAIIVTSFFSYFIKITEWITISFAGKFDETLGLAIFNTLFSLFGTILFFPFIKQFAKVLEWLLREKGNALTRNLDEQLLKVPAVALDVSFKTLMEIIKVLTVSQIELIEAKKVTGSYQKKIGEVDDALKITKQYLDSIQSDSSKIRHRHLDLLHVIDHLNRLIKVLNEQYRVDAVHLHKKIIENWHNLLLNIQKGFDSNEKIIDISKELERVSMETAEQRKMKRNEYFEKTVDNQTEIDLAISKIETIMWIDRLVYHYWRASARMAKFLQSSQSDD